MANTDRMKTLAVLLLAIAAIIFFVYFYNTREPALNLGNEVNMATFTSLLSEGNEVSIVMDVRNVSGEAVKRDILQCGVDFSGSPGLVKKNLTILSLDTGNTCISMKGNLTLSDCYTQMNKGMIILIKEGNSTRFYTNAMVVGMGSNYTANGCNIGLKNQ